MLCSGDLAHGCTASLLNSLLSMRKTGQCVGNIRREMCFNQVLWGFRILRYHRWKEAQQCLYVRKVFMKDSVEPLKAGKGEDRIEDLFRWRKENKLEGKKVIHGARLARYWLVKPPMGMDVFFSEPVYMSEKKYSLFSLFFILIRLNITKYAIKIVIKLFLTLIF